MLAREWGFQVEGRGGFVWGVELLVASGRW